MNTMGLRRWLRERARDRALEAKRDGRIRDVDSGHQHEPQEDTPPGEQSNDTSEFKMFTFDIGTSSSEPCPSCGLTMGRHAYFCALAHPEEE